MPATLQILSASIVVYTAVLVFTQKLNAQAIYRGGNNDGFAKASYAEPDPASDIFRGGVNDGFVAATYSEIDPASDIYNGGINDGFSRSSYTESGAHDIYSGNINDGFAFSTYVDSDPAADIYGGGDNDGFAKASFSEEFALPVEWLYFTISKQKGRPLLQWGADGEQHCLLYEVLRSHDGKKFEPIATLTCHGKRFSNHYEFTDLSPPWQPILYYKLAQHDIDGQLTHSDVKAFHATSPAEPEAYYRNGQLVVSVERVAKLQSVAVYDFTGRTLCRQSTPEGEGPFYTIDCQLAPDQLVVVRLVFDSFAASKHMRIGR